MLFKYKFDLLVKRKLNFLLDLVIEHQKFTILKKSLIKCESLDFTYTKMTYISNILKFLSSGYGKFRCCFPAPITRTPSNKIQMNICI